VSWPDNIPFYKEFKPIFKSLNIPLWLKGCGGYTNNPKFTGELLTYLYFENAHLTTAEYLESIGWNKN
jgi:hypothetical protein